MNDVVPVLVNWNGWPDTLACLQSLDALDVPLRRTVVVDNASSDDSLARIRAAYPAVDVVESRENLGFAGGCNIGIRHALEAGAEYVWLLNNDARVDPSALSALVAVAEADPRVGAVGSVVYHLEAPDRVQEYGGGWVDFLTGRAGSYSRPVEPHRLSYVTGASLLVRREVLEQVGLLDERYFMYWEDADFGVRICEAGWRLAVAPASKVFHVNAGSVGYRSVLQDRYTAASAVRFFRRHAALPAVPIGVGLGGKVLKRLILGEWRNALAVVQGAAAGFRD